jgi:acetyl esterase/lipase
MGSFALSLFEKAGMMLKPSFLFAAAFFFCLAVLPSLELPNVTAWKLSVMATEYGHWLALFPAFLAVLLIRTTRRSLSTFLTAFALCTSAVLFLVPSVQAAIGFRSWLEKTDQAFGTESPPKASAFSVTRLYLGNSDHAVNPVPLTFQDSPSKLVLDFYPAVETAAQNGAEPGKSPWVMVIHGGGWNSGQKTELSELDSYLANRGISVAAISYRLAPKWTWPAPKEDAIAALHFLKEHATELRIDPNRWAVLGRSAGGQIAEDLAYSINDPTLKGCIALYAPADMDFAYEFGKEDDILQSLSLLRQYMGGTPADKAEAYRDASPIDWVRPGDVPTLLLHGEKDTLVWHKQSERLLDRLKTAGVPATLISLPWATHGFDYNINGPGGQITSALTERFLRRVFR